MVPLEVTVTEYTGQKPKQGPTEIAIVVLAAADAFGAPGDALLRATLLGYEMAIRFACAFGTAMSSKKAGLSSHAYGDILFEE